jgi:hypothetical protein
MDKGGEITRMDSSKTGVRYILRAEIRDTVFYIKKGSACCATEELQDARRFMTKETARHYVSSRQLVPDVWKIKSIKYKEAAK